jgi:FlaA1/EpsC-like NDP-sugar epimerase
MIINLMYSRRVAIPAGLFILFLSGSCLALYLSYSLRFDGRIPADMLQQLLHIFPYTVAIQMVFLIFSKQLSVLPSYFSVIDLKSQVGAVVVSTFGLMYIYQALGIHVPRGVRVLDFLLFLGFIVSVRLIFRLVSERALVGGQNRSVGQDIIPNDAAIVGAGAVGALLVRELKNKSCLRLNPIVIFDDDPTKWGKHIHGVPIIGRPELMLESNWNRVLKRVILAMPNANPSRVREVTRLASEIGVTSDTVPALDQIVSGSVKISQVRPVDISDLLRRPQVKLDTQGISVLIQGKIVMVTGSGGSIGSELCRQIIRYSPRQIILIEQSEVQLFKIEQELIAAGCGNLVVPVIADVSSKDRMIFVFSKYRPEIIFHAAAYKHVPLMEMQPAVAIQNNAFGSLNIIKLADVYGVERFVMISTDKAINPTNVMGASKRLAELFMQAFHHSKSGKTLFMAVRFGNVLGSSGSVVPTFERQIATGGPVTVTDPNVTRFFMTIPEAVGLVLQAGSIGEGGEIFVLDMGEPVKIWDLAVQMIRLSGYRPGIDIELKVTGLRPGEKMYEEISHKMESLASTNHPKIFRFNAEPYDMECLEKQMASLEKDLSCCNSDKIKMAVARIVPEYKPSLGLGP